MPILTAGFGSRPSPFHTLPNSASVEGTTSVEDAMKLADLNWEVAIEPAYQIRRDGSTHVIPDRFLTVRQDTEQVLGTVGKVYSPFQNAEAFAFADELLGYGVEFYAAGSWNESRQFFLAARLPEGLTVAGEDAHDMYLLFRSAHDGSSAISATVVPLRIACTNMLPVSAKAFNRWSVRHTHTASERISEAARALNIVDAYTREFNDITAQLHAAEMSVTEYSEFVKELAPQSGERDSRIQRGLVETWNESPTVERGTRWGALNAVSEYYQHLRGGRGDVESRFDSLVAGQTFNTVNRAAELLLRTNR